MVVALSFSLFIFFTPLNWSIFLRLKQFFLFIQNTCLSLLPHAPAVWGPRLHPPFAGPTTRPLLSFSLVSACITKQFGGTTLSSEALFDLVLLRGLNRSQVSESGASAPNPLHRGSEPLHRCHWSVYIKCTLTHMNSWKKKGWRQKFYLWKKHWKKEI